MSLITSKLPHGKMIILKTILRTSKLSPIVIVNAKLFSALPTSSSFYFSDLQGIFCFVVDIEKHIFKIVLYDSDSFEILLSIELLETFKSLYTKIKVNFHSLEMNSGYLGFLIEEEKQFCEQMFIKINKINSSIISELCERFNYDNVSTNNFDLIKKKFLHDFGLKEEQNCSLTKQQITFYLQNINEILSCFSYDESEKTFEYYGSVHKAKELLEKNQIDERELILNQLDDLSIKNCTHYVSILVNHMINDIKLKPKLVQLEKQFKEKIAMLKKKKEDEQAEKEMEILKQLDNERQATLNAMALAESAKSNNKEGRISSNKSNIPEPPPKGAIPLPPPFPTISKKKPTKKTFVMPDFKRKRISYNNEVNVENKTINEENGEDKKEDVNRISSRESNTNKEEEKPQPMRMMRPPMQMDMFSELKSKLGKRESNFDFSKLEKVKKEEKKDEVIDFRKLLKKKVEQQKQP